MFLLILIVLGLLLNSCGVVEFITSRLPHVAWWGWVCFAVALAAALAFIYALSAAKVPELAGSGASQANAGASTSGDNSPLIQIGTINNYGDKPLSYRSDIYERAVNTYRDVLQFLASRQLQEPGDAIRTEDWSRKAKAQMDFYAQTRFLYQERFAVRVITSFAELSEQGVAPSSSVLAEARSGTNPLSISDVAITLGELAETYRKRAAEKAYPQQEATNPKQLESIKLPPDVKRALNTSAGPMSQTVAVGAEAAFSLGATVGQKHRIQWQHNGADIPGETGNELLIPTVRPANAGVYRATLTDTSGATASASVILGVTTDQQTLGGCELIAENVFSKERNNTYDFFALYGPFATITAKPKQIASISYIDLNDDIVHVELFGAGSLTLLMDRASGPDYPDNYKQKVRYIKGIASITVADADESTNVSIYAAGRTTEVNQSIFIESTKYDGVADVSSISILSKDGRFGSLRTANVRFSAHRGITGIFAPDVRFTGPVYIADINASDEASPVIILGAASNVRICGGDLAQLNRQSLTVKGIAFLRFVQGGDAHGKLIPAKTNKAKIVENGRDVTAQIVSTIVSSREN